MLPERPARLDEASLAELVHGASQGRPDAQYLLGLSYFSGDSAARDPVRARDLLQRASGAGHAQAAVALAHLDYEAGDATRARRGAEQAAARGDDGAALLLSRIELDAVRPRHSPQAVDASAARHPAAVRAVQRLRSVAARTASPRVRAEAQHLLAVALEYGVGLAQDLPAAADAYAEAASLGHLTARYHLGLMKAYGRGVPLDHTGAVGDWKVAADRGHAPSMLRLAAMLVHGQGAVQNVRLGLSWLRKAAEAGDERTADAARRAAADVEAALTRVEEWRHDTLEGIRRGRRESDPYR